MPNYDFWSQVNKRVEENREIVQGGMPGSWARVMEWVGLRFWWVGFWISLGITVWVWSRYRVELLQVVRWMVWR